MADGRKKKVVYERFLNFLYMYEKRSTLDVLLCLPFMKYKWAFFGIGGKMFVMHREKIKRKKMRRLKMSTKKLVPKMREKKFWSK